MGKTPLIYAIEFGSCTENKQHGKESVRNVLGSYWSACGHVCNVGGDPEARVAQCQTPMMQWCRMVVTVVLAWSQGSPLVTHPPSSIHSNGPMVTWRNSDMVLSYGYMVHGAWLCDMVSGDSHGHTNTLLLSHGHIVRWFYGNMVTWSQGSPLVPHPLHSAPLLLMFGSKKCLLSAGDSESWRHTRNAWNGCKEPRTVW